MLTVGFPHSPTIPQITFSSAQVLPLLIVVGHIRALWNHTLLQTDIIFMLPEDVCSLLKIIRKLLMLF